MGHWVRALAPVCLAMWLPLLAMRLMLVQRAMTFNASLRAETVREALPAMIGADALAAMVVAAALVPLELIRRRAPARGGTADKTARREPRPPGLGPQPVTRRPRTVAAARWAGRAQVAVCTIAVLVLAAQYRVYWELGFFPSARVFLRFAGPGSPFLSTAATYFNVPTLGPFLVAAAVPGLLLWVGRRLPRVTDCAGIAAMVSALVGIAWSPPPPALQISRVPFVSLWPASFERPSARDPEVSDEPPSTDSIRGDAAAAPCAPEIAPIARGNLVLVVLESTAQQYVFADGRWRYPNLARIAARGLHFTRHYSPAGTSNAALYSILVGRHALPSDAWWDTPYEHLDQTLPGRLRRAGHRTAFFMSGCFRYFFDEKLYRGMGWDACMDGDDLARAEGIPDAQRDPAGHGVDDRQMIDRAIRWIAEQSKTTSPWFCVVYPGVPHQPYFFRAAGPHALHPGRDLSARQLYENQLAYVDGQIGRLYDALAEARFFDRGWFIVTGDHGEAFGQHEGNVIHGTNVYEEDSHVPLLAAGPGLPRGQSCRRLSSHVDLAPTLLELVGLEPAARMIGRSVLAEGADKMVFLAAALDGVKVGVVDGPYKFILNSSDQTSRLYRLDLDPEERLDLASSEPELARRYRSWTKSYVYHHLTPDPLRSGSPAQRAYHEGLLVLSLGRPATAAIEHFRRALQLDPGYSQAREKLAECFREMGLDRIRASRFEAAARQLHEAVRLAPGDTRARTALVETLWRLDRLEEAAEALHGGLTLTPDQPGLLRRLAWMHATATDWPGRDLAAIPGLMARLNEAATETVESMEVRAAVAAAEADWDLAQRLAKEALAAEQARGAWYRRSREAAIESARAAYAARRLPPVRDYPRYDDEPEN